MLTYPTGVELNLSLPSQIPVLNPVSESDWCMFGPPSEAEAGLAFIRTVCPGAVMSDLSTNEYSDFMYETPEAKQLGPRIAVGIVYDRSRTPAQSLVISEYPTEIFDASQSPRPFIDRYSPGDEIELAFNNLDDANAELFWRKKS